MLSNYTKRNIKWMAIMVVSVMAPIIVLGILMWLGVVK